MCVGVYLWWCREAVPVLSQVPPSALHHLRSSRADCAHTLLAGHKKMCEYLLVT